MRRGLRWPPSPSRGCPERSSPDLGQGTGRGTSPGGGAASVARTRPHRRAGPRRVAEGAALWVACAWALCVAAYDQPRPPLLVALRAPHLRAWPAVRRSYISGVRSVDPMTPNTAKQRESGCRWVVAVGGEGGWGLGGLTHVRRRTRGPWVRHSRPFRVRVAVRHVWGGLLRRVSGRPLGTRHDLLPAYRGLIGGGGGVACRLWCIVLVCSRRRQLADRHLLPVP